jgi:hypothetical protein
MAASAGQSTKTVCQFLGTGYSGSSILNLMLDSIHGVRGLGEIYRVYDHVDVRPCGLCQSTDVETIDECRFYDGIDRAGCYRELFQRYPDSRVLVDASKIGNRYPRSEQEFTYRSLYLLKFPHEFVTGSGFKHTKFSTEERFEIWLRANESELHVARGSLVVPYRSFALQADAVLKSICDFLQIPFQKRDDWWNTSTHIIGGNWSARAQMNQRVAGYLDTTEKYQGQSHKIFLDEVWRKQADICRESIRLYDQHRERCDAILRILKMPSVDDMIADIEGVRIGFLPCAALG